MKTKIDPKLRKILTKHFVNQVIPRVGIPICVKREEITDYWMKQFENNKDSYQDLKYLNYLKILNKNNYTTC